VTMTLKPSSSLCEPRWATPRNPARETAGTMAALVAQQMGHPLMPWQQHVVDVALEMEDGRPAYREVIVTVPRQNGKTILMLAVMLQRALGWSEPQRILYSAQTGNDARKKLVEDWVPVLEPRRTRLHIRRILRGMGNESVEFLGGARIVLLASSEDSGHGKTIDLAMHDEIFADIDNRREQATTPAMNTRPAAQMWLTSTMGTDASIFLNAKVARGREASTRGGRTAYFEWSAPKDADIDDPATWRSCMPALGWTIDESVIQAARETLPEGEFRRAYLNQQTTSDERIISAVQWEAVQDERTAPKDPIVLGFDVAPDRSAASVAASDGETVEVMECRPGVGWATDRVVELARKWGAPVALDPAAAAGSFMRDLTDRGVTVVEVAGRDLVQACGSFYDRVVNHLLKIVPHPDLDLAVAGAVRRSVQDAWAWNRKSSDVDITPLVASTLAIWVAGAGAPEPQVFAY